MVLASGSNKYLSFVLPKLKYHHRPFIYPTDIVFKDHRQRDIMRLLQKLSSLCVHQGLLSSIVMHANFGGVSSAVHLMSYCRVDPSVFTAPPFLPQVLAHIINPASPDAMREIPRPDPLKSTPRAPIESGGVLCLEGLFDVFHPQLRITCPCVFKSTGWAQRPLSAREHLRAFDIPLEMDEALLDKCRDRQIQSVLQQAVTPLIISAVFCAMWLHTGGDTGHTGVEQPELTLHETNADYNDEDGITINRRKTEVAIRRLAQRWSHTTHYDFRVQDEDSSSELARREPHTTLGNSAMQDEDSSSDQVEREGLEIEHIVAPRSHEILNEFKDKHDISKAVKADDTKVPVELWDKAVCQQPPTVEQLRALLILRGFMLQLYCL
jgi:hypothetical protein